MYFHALFIEPALRPCASAAPGPVCCNHGAAPGRHTVEELLSDSAWAALTEVAATLPDYHQPCPTFTGACCASCRIVAAAGAVAAGWAQTEARAYQHKQLIKPYLRACQQAAATRLGCVFAAQHAAWCPALERLAEAPTTTEPLPGPEKLPLTGELLALWADPTATTRHPVTSWLNHCTGLDDVRRALVKRRTGT